MNMIYHTMEFKLNGFSYPGHIKIYKWNDNSMSLHIFLDNNYSTLELIFRKIKKIFILNSDNLKNEPNYNSFGEISKTLIKNNWIQQINETEYKLTNTFMLKLI